MKTSRLFIAAAAAAIVGLASGCATWQKITTAVSSPEAQPYILAGAQIAVATAETKGVTRAQILDVAQQGLAASANTSASLSTVASAINAELIKLNLPQGDIDAAIILEATFSAYIQSKVGNNADLAQTRAAIADVLNAIIAAAGGLPTPPVTSNEAPTFVPLADVPQQNKHFVLASVEAPTVVGSAASLVLVSSLQAFGHVSVGAPVAAAITVLFTAGAALISNLVT